MIKLTSQLLGAIAGAFALALFITLNVYLTPFLGAWMIAIDLVLLISAAVVVSHVGNFSIPVLKTLLKREYYRVKFKEGRKKKSERSGVASGYMKFLAGLIMLFKSAEEGFEVIKDEAHEIHGKAILFAGEEKKKGKALADQLFHIHRSKQRRAATVSVTALFLFVIGSVLTALVSTMMYPSIFQSQAATYTWIQDNWSGGATTTVAEHSDGSPEQDWRYYESKDSEISIDGDGNITMNSGTQDVEETSTSQFNAGDTSDLNTGSDEIKLGCKDSWVGNDGPGGVVAFCDGDSFVIAQSSDISGGAEWGCYGDSISGADSNTNGEQNTQDIINGCSESGIAARLCANSTEGGYNDWFLPAKSQLNSMYNNKSAIGGFASDFYWSSTEYTSGNAWYQIFDDGFQYKNDKNNSYRVRCLRSF